MTTTTPNKPGSTAAPDWDRIELDYRAGIKPLRTIAGEHGITDGAIRKRAKRDGWTRDLAKRIQAKADELVRKEAVRSEVRTEKAASERQVIEANAIAVADVRLAHRQDIHRSRRIVMSLLDELEQQTGSDTAAMLEQLGELLRTEDKNGQDKLNDLYHKLISLPGRAKTMKDLGESLRVLVALERQAFGLDDKENSPTDALTSLLHGIASTNSNAFVPVADDPEYDEERPAGSAYPMRDDEPEED